MTTLESAPENKLDANEVKPTQELTPEEKDKKYLVVSPDEKISNEIINILKEGIQIVTKENGFYDESFFGDDKTSEQVLHRVFSLLKRLPKEKQDDCRSMIMRTIERGQTPEEEDAFYRKLEEERLFYENRDSGKQSNGQQEQLQKESESTTGQQQREDAFLKLREVKIEPLGGVYAQLQDWISKHNQKPLRPTQESLKEEETMKQAIEKYGKNLEVSEVSQAVFHHIEMLNLVPENFVRFLSSLGLKIKLGNFDITDFPGKVNLKLKNPSKEGYHFDPRETYIGMSGIFYPSELTAYAGTNEHGAVVNEGVALHEYGHGAGQLLKLDNSKSIDEAHARLFEKLSRYEQQEGPGSVIGKKELLACAFDAYFTLSKNQFIHKYDEPLYLFLEEAVNNPEETLLNIESEI